jgi:hypothetical protein
LLDSNTQNPSPMTSSTVKERASDHHVLGIISVSRSVKTTFSN